MRYVERLSEPEILKKNKNKWTEKFIESKKERPQNYQYGHDKIRELLDSMSFHKCFYCEQKIKGKRKEVDHYIEISEDKKLAFDWNNLYLSCDSCNSKLSNKTIPNSETLNPCLDTDDEIMKHITYEDEQITAVSGSKIGLTTIQKYKLDTESQDINRRKKHREFETYHKKVLEKMIEEGRKHFDENEIEFFNSFTQKDKPYSLMFKILVTKIFNKKK